MFLQIVRYPDLRISRFIFSVICYFIWYTGMGQLQSSKDVYLKNTITTNPDIWYLYGDELFSFVETTEETLYAYVVNDGSFDEKYIGIYQRFNSSNDKAYGGNNYSIVNGDWAIRVSNWGKESRCDPFNITCDYGVTYQSFGDYDPGSTRNYTGRFYLLDIDQLDKTGLGGSAPIYSKELVEYECLECSSGWSVGTSSISCSGTVTPKTIRLVLVVLNPVYGTTASNECINGDDMLLIDGDGSLLDPWPGVSFQDSYTDFISDITTDNGDHTLIDGNDLLVDISEHGDGLVNMNVTWEASPDYYLNLETDYVYTQEFTLGEVYAVPEIVIPDNLTLCNNSGLVDLPDGSPSGGDWSGSHVVDGQFDTDAALAGDYTVSYSYTNSDGCSATAEMALRLEAVDVSTLDDFSICEGESTSLEVFGAESYVWSPGTGLSATVGSSVIATPATTTTYTVTGTTADGCIDSDEVTITVRDLPSATVTSSLADDEVCRNEPFTLSLPDAGVGAIYSWTPSSRLDNPSIREPTAVISSGTEFRVRVTDDNGCETEETLFVSVNDPPIAEAGGSTDVCPGEDHLLNGTGNSGVGPLQYSWSGNGIVSGINTATPTINITSDESYTLTVTDANGCISTDRVNASVDVVTAYAGQDRSICEGESVQLSGSGGATYSWVGDGLNDPNISSPTATPGTIGNHVYTLTVTSANGCVSTDDVNVNVLGEPDLVLTSDQTICKGESVILSASGALSYDWSPSSGLNVTNLASVTASPTSTVVYTVEGMNSNGCIVEEQVVVYVNDPPEADAGSTKETCVNEELVLNGSATLGVGPYNYSWSGVGIVSGENTASPTISITSDQTYTLTVTDANGCSDIDYVDVRVNSLPNAVISVNDFVTTEADICRGEVVQLEAFGGNSYQWSGDPGLSNPTIQDPVITVDDDKVLDVVITNSNGCVGQTSITLNAVDNPVVDAGEVLKLCIDDELYDLRQDVNIQGGVFDGDGVVDGFLFDAGDAGPGIYLIDYEVAVGGCLGSDMREVRVREKPSISTIDDLTTCRGDSVTLNAFGGVQYEWIPSAGLSDPTIANPKAGPLVTTTYTVTGTDIYGCTNTATVVVSVNDFTVHAGTNETICEGEGVLIEALSSGQSAVSFVWSPAEGLNDTSIESPVASPTETTTYTVAATDVLGCTVTDEVTVTVIPDPGLVVGPKLWLCDSDTEPVDLRTGVSIPGGEFNSSSSGLEGVLFYGSREEPGIYFVTYEVMVGECLVSRVREVQVMESPEVMVSDDAVICKGEAVNLEAVGSGQEAVSYSWWPTDGLSDPNIANPVASPAVTTSYTVEITDVNGCIGNASVTVEVEDPEVGVIGDVEMCQGEYVGLWATGGETYRWSPATTLDDRYAEAPVASPMVTTLYTVEITNRSGCIETEEVLVTVAPAPDLEVGGVLVLCQEGDTPYDLRQDVSVQGGVFASTSSGLTGVEFDPSGVSDPGIYFVDYTVIIEGCTVTRTREIRVKGAPEISSLFNTYEICAGEGVELNIETFESGATYEWFPKKFINNPRISNPVVSPISDQTYTVVVTSMHGCQAQKEIDVDVTNFSVDTGGDVVVCEGEGVILEAVGSGQEAVSYRWWPTEGLSDPEIANPVASPEESTTYSVEVTSADGCIDEDQVKVTVLDNPDIVFVNEELTICENEGLVDLQTFQLSDSSEDLFTVFTWEGPGVSEMGLFDPEEAGPGSFMVRVSYENLNGCSDEAFLIIRVPRKPIVDAGPDIEVCHSDSVVELASAAVPEGGVFGGAGVTGSQFIPTMAGAGEHVITYTYTDPLTGCENQDVRVIDVLNSQAVFAGPPISLCIDAEPLDLSQSVSPGGGIFTADMGVNGDYFYPSTGAGEYHVLYSVVDESGCTSSMERVITVNERPILELESAVISVCENEGIVNLNAYPNISGGTWSGSTGIVNGLVKVDSLGIGSNILSYAVNTSDGCTLSTELIVQVAEVQELALGGTINTCFGGDRIDLLGNFNRELVSVTGPGVVDGVFDPGMVDRGTYEAVYRYENSNGCVAEQRRVIVVQGEVFVSAGPTISVCQNFGDVDLLGYGFPQGGTWSGLYVELGTFDAVEAPVGLYEAVYTIDLGLGCVNSDTLMIDLSASDITDFGVDTIVCVNGPEVVLNFSHELEGGEWSGSGVVNNIFYPSEAGPGSWELSYSNGGLSCDVAGSRVIRVIDVPPKAVTETYSISGCVGDIVRVTADLLEQGGHTQVNYAWYYEGERTPFAMGKSIEYRIRASENIYFTSVNAFGCEAVERDFIRVSANGPVGDIEVDKDTVAIGELVRFKSFGSNVESYFWEFGDGNYSELKDPLYYFYNTGWHTITLTMRSPDGCEFRVKREDLVYVYDPNDDVTVLSVADPNSDDIVIFPNPSRGVFVVEVPDDFVGGDVIVYTLDGREVKGREISHAIQSRARIRIDLSGEPSGTYVVMVRKNDRVEYRKVVVER